MRNKILKLVLNKNNSKHSVILDKKEGNSTSLIAGLLFFMVILILVMFNYRMNMLSEVLYNIDDNLTASVLGAALPNKDAYAVKGAKKSDGSEITASTKDYLESNQLILQDAQSLDTKTVQDGYVSIFEDYTNDEKPIAVSELNTAFLLKHGKYDADAIYNKAEQIYTFNSNIKKVQTSGKYKLNNRKIMFNDSYTINTISNLVGLTYTNITQNLEGSTDKQLTSLYDNSGTLGVTDNLKDFMTISKDDVLDTSFIGKYLATDMDITRLQIYDVYRYTLAERHVYASPYFIYTVNGVPGYTWDGYNLDGTVNNSPDVPLSSGIKTNAVKDMVNATYIKNGTRTEVTIEPHWNPAVPQVLDKDGANNDFKDLILQLYPAMAVRGRIPGWLDKNPTVPSTPDTPVDTVIPDYFIYDLMEALWKVDLESWNTLGSTKSVFYTDSGVTCQTDWFTSEQSKYYGYIWNNNSYNVIPITDSVLMNDQSKTRRLLPIEGYSVYFYTKDSNKVDVHYNSFSMDNSGNNLSYIPDKAKQPILIGDYNADNKADDEITTVDNKFTTILDDGSPVYKTNKKSGTKIYYTGIYLETAFDIKTFPGGGNFLAFDAYNRNTVTQGRLVTITE